MIYQSFQRRKTINKQDKKRKKAKGKQTIQSILTEQSFTFSFSVIKSQTFYTC